MHLRQYANPIVPVEILNEIFIMLITVFKRRCGQRHDEPGEAFAGGAAANWHEPLPTPRRS